MKKIIFATLAALAVICASAQVAPPAYTVTQNLTPGQAPVVYNVGTEECFVYGSPCPSPEGVYYYTFIINQLAAGPMTIALSTTVYCVSRSCFHTSYSNAVVKDVNGNALGTWAGDDWSAADLPVGTYYFTVTANSLLEALHWANQPGTHVYPYIVFQ